jgi:hypothetical protein
MGCVSDACGRGRSRRPGRRVHSGHTHLAANSAQIAGKLVDLGRKIAGRLHRRQDCLRALEGALQAEGQGHSACVLRQPCPTPCCDEVCH